MEYYLSLPLRVYNKLLSHLFADEKESAAFIFVKSVKSKGYYNFKFCEWKPVAKGGYISRSPEHLNLTEETWANAIKRAHNVQATLVELHSHTGFEPVYFSTSDFCGFDEFVPHIKWRLEDKPYLALVFNKTSYDGLVWKSDSDIPHQITGVYAGDKLLKPTKLSLKNYKYYESGKI